MQLNFEASCYLTLLNNEWMPTWLHCFASVVLKYFDDCHLPNILSLPTYLFKEATQHFILVLICVFVTVLSIELQCGAS